MASLNQVQLIGYLGRDPKLKSGADYSFVNLSLATDESYKDRNGNKVQKTEWHRVIVGDKLADTCVNYLHKGSLVYVEGKLETRKFNDRDGVDRHVTEIRASASSSLTARTPRMTGRTAGKMPIQVKMANLARHSRRWIRSPFKSP